MTEEAPHTTGTSFWTLKDMKTNIYLAQATRLRPSLLLQDGARPARHVDGRRSGAHIATPSREPTRMPTNVTLRPRTKEGMDIKVSVYQPA